MRAMRGSLLPLVAYSALVGLAIEISTWYVGVPMLFGLIGVIYWSCDQVLKRQRQNKPVSSTPLIISTLLMFLCGLGIIVSSIYLPVAVNTLIVINLSVIPTRCVLLFGQWIKIRYNLRAVVAITTPLTLIGIISTGLSINFASPSLVPALVLLIHSAILLVIGLYGTKFIASNVALGVSLLLLLSSTVASFVSYFLAPFWCSFSVITTSIALPLVFLAEFCSTSAFAKHSGCGSIVQLIAAAAAGVAIAADLPHALIVSTLALLPSNMLIGVYLSRIHWEIRFDGKPDKHHRLQGATLATFLILTVILLVSFHFALSSMIILIPFILLAITAICTSAVHILYRLKMRNACYNCIGLLLLFLSFYLLFVVCSLNGKEFKYSPEAVRSCWKVHLVALFTTLTLAFHCFAVQISWSLQSERLSLVKRAAGLPSVTDVSLADYIGSTSPVLSLFILVGCSIILARISWFSWMAAIPAMAVYCGITAWMCCTLKNIDKKTYWIVAPVSILLQLASIALIFIFAPNFFCLVFVIFMLSFVTVSTVAECAIAGLAKGLLRVSCTWGIFCAIATGITEIVDEKLTPACITCYVYNILFLACILQGMQVRNYSKGQMTSVLKRPQLFFAALVLIGGLMVALIIAYHFLRKTIPALIPLIFVGLHTLYLLALYVIYTLRDRMKYQGRTGILLSLLFTYLLFVILQPDIARSDEQKTIVVAMFTVFAFSCHFLSFSCASRCCNDNSTASSNQPAAPAVAAALPLQAVAAAPAAAVVVERDVDSDYESVDGEVDDGGQNA